MFTWTTRKAIKSGSPNPIPLTIPTEIYHLPYSKSGVIWFSIKLPQFDGVLGTLVIDTLQSEEGVDTEIALYKSDGNLVEWGENPNDDAVVGQDEFGDDVIDGPLSRIAVPPVYLEMGKVYYIVVGLFNTEFGQNFRVVPPTTIGDTRKVALRVFLD